MISGNDVRRYRKLIGLKQDKFAAALGVSQSALSLLESGRIAVSDEHITRLRKAFDSGKHSFSNFLKDVGRQQRQSQAALTPPDAGHVTLPVCRWRENFDLSRPMPPEMVADLITVRGAGEPMIAFIMTARTAHWESNEILVFRRCAPHDVQAGDICLVQSRPPHARQARTYLAVVEAPKRREDIWLSSVSPIGLRCTVTDSSLITIMRAVFRARYA